jgi:anthranilate synthase component 1
MAGSPKGGAHAATDLALEREMLASEKECAEHVMLVDLARNDVGRVSVFGSVRVDPYMIVERYSHVMHIVSAVAGRLAPGLDAWDALIAGFPAGTVSGAPKVRAMEILTELEGQPRGPYAGAVGFFGPGAQMDTCIAIRMLQFEPDGKVTVQAGAGIVADSLPEMEYQEIHHKAAQGLAALKAAAEGLL